MCVRELSRVRVYLFCFFEIFYARDVVSLSLSSIYEQNFSLVRSLPFSLRLLFFLAGTRPFFFAEKDARIIKMNPY